MLEMIYIQSISCVFREEKSEPRIVLIENLYKDSRGEQVRTSILSQFEGLVSNWKQFHSCSVVTILDWKWFESRSDLYGMNKKQSLSAHQIWNWNHETCLSLLSVAEWKLVLSTWGDFSLWKQEVLGKGWHFLHIRKLRCNNNHYNHFYC